MSTIRILTLTEIRNFESPPRFDSFSRKKFFTLPISLMKEVEILRASSGKIAFILQTGYFRSANRFFGNRFYEADIAYVAGRLSLTKLVTLEVPKQTLARNRKVIADFYGFRRLTKNDKAQLLIEIADSVKLFTRPAEVFLQILKKLNSRKFILPGYDFLSEVVLMNEDGKELLQITAVAGDKMQRKVGTKHFVREQNVILRISTREDKEVKLLTYKIKLDGAIKIETPSTTVPETTPTPQPLSTNPPIEQPTNTNSQPASINPPTTKIDEKPASLLFSDMAETKL